VYKGEGHSKRKDPQWQRPDVGPKQFLPEGKRDQDGLESGGDEEKHQRWACTSDCKVTWKPILAEFCRP